MFDNKYPNRKDQREEYRGVQNISRSCRHGGSCTRCEKGRLYKVRLAERIAEEKEREYS